MDPAMAGAPPMDPAAAGGPPPMPPIMMSGEDLMQAFQQIAEDVKGSGKGSDTKDLERRLTNIEDLLSKLTGQSVAAQPGPADMTPAPAEKQASFMEDLQQRADARKAVEDAARPALVAMLRQSLRGL
jgi:hypothetical protein